MEKQIYKTGDFAWKDRNGILHYVGRKDRQIKIRGNHAVYRYAKPLFMRV